MKIKEIEPFVLHVPVSNGSIEDSTHRLSHWGAPGVIIRTDAGIDGYGYTGTHAHLPTDRLIVDCIAGTYAPLLEGEDPLANAYLHTKLLTAPPILWVGRSGITHLALSAVDIALWDIKAKAAKMPLWKVLGGHSTKQVEAYNTDGGWLNCTDAVLVENARRSVGEGYRGVKIKVGSTDPDSDIRRIEAVRRAIESKVRLMVDANGRWNLPTAMTISRHFDKQDVYWIEEPLWFDDLAGHAALARNTSTPIALGEQLYTIDDFRNFIHSGAVQIVQPDAVRLAGITEWQQVADLCLAYRLPVVPHIGDMMQVHLHLAIAHPACSLLEYIPWMRDCFKEPATVVGGYFVPPELPGAGTTLNEYALERYGI